MATCVKKIFFCAFLAAITSALSASNNFNVINADGADLAFRKILIDKSIRNDIFNCTVTQDNFKSAMQKLADNKCDMVIVKGDLNRQEKLPQSLAFKQFAVTSFIIIVHKDNPLKKLKISELRKIWNGDYNNWGYFNPENFFSIHRFGMPLDDSAFLYLKKYLQLKENVQHFPLDSASQIITMVRSNPNAIGIAVMSAELNFNGIKLIQLTDDNGKNIPFNMPHNVIFRKNDREKIEKFLKTDK